MARPTKSKKKQTGPKPAKACRCAPQKPLNPVSAHALLCPVSKRHTANGRIISDLMHSKKVRGNAKDYVVLSGATLIDFHGSYEMRLEGTQLKISKVRLVHKRNLHRFIGSERAANFWRPGFGRISYGN